MKTDHKPLIIGVVGVCGSGKSTLVAGLRRYGIEIRHIAQEHSYVPYMWQRIAHPDLLIYLDASYAETIRRRRLNWTAEEYQEQVNRLRHAREHANLYLDTNTISQEEVLRQVVNFLADEGVLDRKDAPESMD